MSEMPLGTPIPDDPLEGNPHDAFDGIEDDALESMLDTAVETGEIPEPPEEKEAEPAPADTEQEMEEAQSDEEAPVEQEAKPTEEPKAEEPKEEDLDPVQRRINEIEERHRLELDQRDAKLELQMAHGSRLAGQIGELKKRLEQPPARPEHMPEDESVAYENDRLARIERTLAALSGQRQADDVDLAVKSSLQEVVMSRPELQQLSDEVAEVVPRYAQEWQAALDSTDAGVARTLARAVAVAIVADAKMLKYDKDREAAKKQEVELTDKLKEAKKRAAPTVSTPSSTTRPAAKTVSDLSDDELDDLIDAKLAAGR